MNSFCTSDCKLKTGFQCNPSTDECCSTSGHFLPQVAVCSFAPYPGVSAPTCSGTSGTCPNCYPALTHPCDAYSNIVPCDLGVACLAGCVFTGQTTCYPATSIGGIKVAYLPDGTCCPGGTCRNGTCVGAASITSNGSGVPMVGEAPINVPLETTRSDEISYKNGNSTPRILIIVASAVGGAFVLFMVVCVVMVTVRSRRSKPSKYEKEVEVSTITDETMMSELPPDTPTVPTSH